MSNYEDLPGESPYQIHSIIKNLHVPFILDKGSRLNSNPEHNLIAKLINENHETLDDYAILPPVGRFGVQLKFEVPRKKKDEDDNEKDEDNEEDGDNEEDKKKKPKIHDPLVPIFNDPETSNKKRKRYTDVSQKPLTVLDVWNKVHRACKGIEIFEIESGPPKKIKGTVNAKGVLIIHLVWPLSEDEVEALEKEDEPKTMKRKGEIEENEQEGIPTQSGETEIQSLEARDPERG